MQYSGILVDWHDFYLAIASASGALAGLLFVSLSLHVRTVVERSDVRGLARVTFTNFVLILLISLFLLIPTAHAAETGQELLITALVSVVLDIPPTAEAFRRSGDRTLHIRTLLYRFGLSLIGLASLAAVGMLFLGGQPEAGLRWLVAPVFMLLLVALRNTWDILVTVAEHSKM